MKIYLGHRFLWRVFTYNFYIKIILGFLPKVFTYNQGTKTAALRWNQKAPFFLTRKNVIFWIRKKSVFSHRKSWTTPKSTVKKHNHEKEKWLKIYSRKFPPKITFLELFWAKALARPKKYNFFFPQTRFPKYRYFFGVGRPKNGENSTPSAERKHIFGKKFKKKFVFLGFFEM